MNETNYLCTPIDSVCMGPHTLLCTNWSLLVERISPTDLKGFLYILPSTHPSQNEGLAAAGMFIPITDWVREISVRLCSLRCPNRWCLRSTLLIGCLATDAFSDTAGSQSSWYSLSVTDPIPSSFPSRVRIQHLVGPNFTTLPLLAAALTENKLHANLGTYRTLFIVARFDSLTWTAYLVVRFRFRQLQLLVRYWLPLFQCSELSVVKQELLLVCHMARCTRVHQPLIHSREISTSGVLFGMHFIPTSLHIYNCFSIDTRPLTGREGLVHFPWNTSSDASLYPLVDKWVSTTTESPIICNGAQLPELRAPSC